MLNSDNFLLIMRHAHSDMPKYLERDFDRPLNSSGQKQALRIASKLSSLGLNIKQALVSPARRTTETYELVAQKLKSPPEVFFDMRLYRASFLDLITILGEHAEGSDNLLLIGHNPAVSELCYKLSGQSYLFEPACLAIFRAKKNNLRASLESEFGFDLERIITPIDS